MGTTKKVWNFFTIAQWEEEEKWLSDMARNGWNLVGVNCLLRYVFEKGNAGEYIYKLDLPDNLEHGMDESAYCNFLAECGIEVVCKQKQWLYLRKRAADGPFAEKDDLVAKLQMTNKAYDYAIRTLSTLLRVFTLLLLGVNIGGVGTLISSLASLITFREYTSHVKGKTAQYIGLFSAFNFGFLIVLTISVIIFL